MRHLWIAAAVGLTACGSGTWNSYDGDLTGFTNGDASYLQYPTSRTMQIATRVDSPVNGMAIANDMAAAEMGGLTCGIHLTTGSITFDEDLNEGEVHDGDASPSLELQAIHTAGSILSIIDLNAPLNPTNFLVRGVREARVTGHDSFVALAQNDDGQCELRWFNDHVFEGMQTLSSSCDGMTDLAVDRTTKTAYVAADGDVWRAQPDEAAQLPVVGDLVSWDESQLYVAQQGGSTIQVLQDDEHHQTLELSGALVAMHDGGDIGGLVVATNAKGLGAVQRFDHAGAAIDTLSFNRSLTDLTVDQTGTRMGVATSEHHAYYYLN